MQFITCDTHLSRHGTNTVYPCQRTPPETFLPLQRRSEHQIKVTSRLEEARVAEVNDIVDFLPDITNVTSFFDA